MSSFSSWLNLSDTVSFFLFSCGLSGGVTQIVNLEAEKSTFSSLQENIWAENENPPPEIVLT